MVDNNYLVDTEALDGVRNNLRNAHDKLDGIAKSIPKFDAGILSGPLEHLLSCHLVNAAQFSISSDMAANNVHDSKSAYKYVETTATGCFTDAGEPK